MLAACAMIPPNTSLVRYENPVLVAKNTEPKSSAKVRTAAHTTIALDHLN
jgi:hypothetical protein